MLLVAILFYLVREDSFRWQDFTLVLLNTIGYWEGSRFLFFVFSRRYPGYEQTLRRVLLHIISTFLFICLYSLVAALGERVVNGTATSFWYYYQLRLSASLVPTTIIVAIYESIYFFQEARRYAIRSAELEKQSALSRFETLKQQVDPHFLFNSLNTMSSLIGDNPPAQQFLLELVDIYRYVLLSKNNPTVSLSEELGFVDSYLYLNQIRFRDQITVVKEIPVSVLRKHVPPITVQMLIENAIKHNAISTKVPLCITLQAGPDSLRVTNTTRPKTILEKGSKQGLQNIISRFQLLTNRPVLIDVREGYFSVTLPLLTP